MSYKALYRKYRPTQFNDVVGQEHIVKTLKNIIEKDKVSHAYLFAGPRGTGKTSIAHIFAKNLNCKDLINKTITCGKCEPCIIENNIDIIEIDAASNNGVSEVRSIIDNSRYAPSISKYKVYIIDEVHMLSKGAFNALLKTLEEPPEHVIFILATTEPHKIPMTILSRTQRFNFRRISINSIIDRLIFILDNEKIEYEKDALKVIANMAKGGMRDAISIADQASSYSQEGITSKILSEVFGILSNEQIINLINSINNSETKKVLNNFNNFVSEGYEVNKLVESIINVLKEFIIYNKTQNLNFIHYLTKNNLHELKLSVDFAFKLIDIFVEASSDIKFSEMPFQVLELAMLKALSINNNSEEKLENIFETNEIVKPENVISNEDYVFEDSPQSIQEKINNTMELTMNQNIEDVNEEASEIEEEILKQDPSKSTDELNISNLFSVDETKETKIAEEKSTFTVDEIINLLIQADKEVHIKNKEKWLIKDSIISSEDRQLINLLNKTNLISSSDDFIILESEDSHVIKEINRIREKQSTLKTIAKILESPKLVFAITKEEFEKIKSTWINLSQSDTLPNPQPINKPVLKQDDINNTAEDLGNSIFGDIFKS